MSTFQVKAVAQWRLSWQSDVVVVEAAVSVAAADTRASNAIAERDEALSEYDSAREQADAAKKQAAKVSADWRTAQRRWMLLLRRVSSDALSITSFTMQFIVPQSLGWLLLTLLRGVFMIQIGARERDAADIVFWVTLLLHALREFEFSLMILGVSGGHSEPRDYDAAADAFGAAAAARQMAVGDSSRLVQQVSSMGFRPNRRERGVEGHRAEVGDECRSDEDRSPQVARRLLCTCDA